MWMIDGRYLKLDTIGLGGMGVVYRVKDRLTNEMLALKQVTLNPHNLVFNSHLSQNLSNDIYLALAHEFKTVASLKHPHIISVYNYGFTLNDLGQPYPYFTMQLLENAKNCNKAAQERPLATKIEWVTQLLQALAYLHQHHIIHRDLKPHNILIDETDQLKVLDFGLAIHKDSSQERAGTLFYMAPEVITDNDISISSDLFAVGVIAYEMPTGDHPFLHRGMGGQINPDPDLTAIPATDPIRQFIGKLLQKNKTDRYDDARTALQALYTANNRSIPPEVVDIRESYLQTATFIGRDAELSQLMDTLAKTRQDKLQIYFLGGESGVGKTRLIDELRIRALVEGVIVLQGQAIAERDTPYQLWRDVLRPLSLRVELSDSEASILQLIVPDIAQLLGRSVQDLPIADSQTSQARLLNTIESLFSRQSQPLLVLLEDLQWARDESLKIIRHLAEHLKDRPIFILGSYRDDEAPSLPNILQDAEVLRLKRFGKTDIARLSVSMLGEKVQNREALVEFLDSQTEGNIYFIIEVIRTLSENINQLSDIGKYPLPQNVFVEGMKSVFARRLKHLPTQMPLEQLQLVAVAGRWLDLTLLKHILMNRDTKFNLETWLTLGTNYALFERSDRGWRFTHDKLREHILTTIAPEQKKQLHEQIALGLEIIYPDDVQQSNTLFYHWQQVDNIDKQRHYAKIAGQNALQIGAYHEAIRLLSYAVKHYENLYTLAILEADLARAFYGLSNMKASQQHINQALTHLNAPTIPQKKYHVFYRIGLAVLEQIIYQLLPHRLIRANSQNYSRFELKTELYMQSAITCMFDNLLEASLLSALLGANYAERIQYAYSLAYGYAGIAYIPYAPRLLRPITRYYMQQSLEQFSSMPEDASQARAYSAYLVSISLLSVNMPHTAKDYGNYTEKLLKQIGEGRRRMDILSTLALLTTLQAEYQTAYQQRQETYEYGLKFNDVRVQSWGISGMGIVALHRGDLAEVAQRWDEREQIIQQLQSHNDDTSNLTLVAYRLILAWRQQDIPETINLLDAALAEIHQIRFSQIHDCFAQFFYVEAIVGLYERYPEQYKNAAKQVIKITRQFRLFYPLVESRLLIWEGLYAQVSDNPKKAERLWREAIQSAERNAMPYDTALAMYYRGVYTDDQTKAQCLISDAAESFDELGALWDRDVALDKLAMISSIQKRE